MSAEASVFLSVNTPIANFLVTDRVDMNQALTKPSSSKDSHAKTTFNEPLRFSASQGLSLVNNNTKDGLSDLLKNLQNVLLDGWSR